MKLARALLQIGVLSLAYFGCDQAARALSSPIPGGVLGAIVLATLLLGDVLPLSWVEDGADLLLKNLGLFFVPAAVVAMRQQLGIGSVVALTIISALTTVLVLVVTALLAARGERP